MASVEEIFSQINELKPMEIATLIKRMETEWGVTAAPAAVAVAGPAGGGGAAAPPGGKTGIEAILLSSRGKKKQGIKESPAPLWVGVQKDKGPVAGGAQPS